MNDQPPVHINVTPPPEPSFQITLREVYDVTRSVESKLDKIADLPHDVADHETRIRALEGERGTYVTRSAARWIVTVLAALAPILATVTALFVGR